MNIPTASIIIPVYNRAHLVRRAIDSALAQTLPCEVVLVDHGSSDDIVSVANIYGDKIRYVRREFDQGPIASWIDGAHQAVGEFLHFTYDDDWIQPTFIERCVNSFDENVAFVYTRATIRDSLLKNLGVIVRHPPGCHPVRDLVQYLLSKPLPISPGCATFRRKDVLENLLPEIPGAKGVYGKNSGVGEDLLLFLLTSLHYQKYVHVAEPLADFLSHSGSITVNAQETGNALKLADAYSVAKSYYLTQLGSEQPLEGPAKLLFAMNWWLRSRIWPGP